MGARHPEEKRAAVEADLILGMSIRATAAKHEVHRRVVERWRSELPQRHPYTLQPRDPSRPAQARPLGHLLYDLLQKQINAETRILRQTESQEWLDKQSADSLGDFLDRIAHHRMGLLVAAARAGALGSPSDRGGSGEDSDQLGDDSSVGGEVLGG